MDSHLRGQRNEDRREYHEDNVRDHRADRHLAGIANAQHTGPQTLQLHFAGEQLATKVRWCGEGVVAVDRKLEALTSVLTARQRAIIGLERWRVGEAADERLQRLCPPEDRAELDGIMRAVVKGNSEINSSVAFLLEWVANDESLIHALRVIQAYQAREAALPASAKRGLPRLPAPWDWERRTQRVYGTSIVRNEPTPATWEAHMAMLVRDLRESIQLRWQDYLQAESALSTASRAMGTDVTHVEIRTSMDALRDGIIHLRDQMAEAGHEVTLPELDLSLTSYAKGAFNLDVLREIPKDKQAREWLSPQALAELEEWEREQAALAGE